MTNTEKLEKAIAYLRSRDKYIVDATCNFTPTKTVQTDVAETIRIYHQEVNKQPVIKLVEKKKK